MAKRGEIVLKSVGFNQIIEIAPDRKIRQAEKPVKVDAIFRQKPHMIFVLESCL